MPLVGSSSSSTSGLAVSTFAMAARCCSPPERAPGSRSSRGRRSSRSAIHPAASCPLAKLLPQTGLSGKEGSGLLGQQGRLGVFVFHFPAPGLQTARQQPQGRGLAAAVAAHDGEDLTLVHCEVHPPQHVRAGAVIAEPDVLQRRRRSPPRRLRQGKSVLLAFGGCAAAAPCLPARPWGSRRERPAPPQIRTAAGMAAKNGSSVHKALGDLLRRAPGGELAPTPAPRPGPPCRAPAPAGAREQNRDAQLPVHPLHGTEKLPRRDGIELRGWLIEHENLRLHHHDGRQIQKLLLAAGERIGALVKPVLNAEEAGHLRPPGGAASPTRRRDFPGRRPARARPCP